MLLAISIRLTLSMVSFIVEIHLNRSFPEPPERVGKRAFQPGDLVVVHKDHCRRYTEMMFLAYVVGVQGKKLLLEPVQFWRNPPRKTLVKKTLVSFARSSNQIMPELEQLMKLVKLDPKAHQLLKAKAQWENISTYTVLNNYGHPQTWESYFS